MPKLIKYKGVEILKPDTMSLKYLKKVIDRLGKDYSFTVQNVVDFIYLNEIKS